MPKSGKQRPRRRLKALRHLEERRRLQASGSLPLDLSDPEIPTGKMSDVLMAFVAPAMESMEEIGLDSEESLRKLLTLAAIAWNTAMFPEAERSEVLAEAVARLPKDPALRREFTRIVDQLILRKQTHFAGIRRFILDFSLTSTDDDYHLRVLSTLTPPPPGRLPGRR